MRPHAVRAAGVLAPVAVAALAMVRSNVLHGTERKGAHGAERCRAGGDAPSAPRL